MYPIAKSDKTPLIDEKTYAKMYQHSIQNPDKFWAQKAKEFLDWDKDWEVTSNVDYHQGLIEWFKGGELNVAYNCIDRHLPERAEQTAIIWEGDNPEVSQKVTYQQLHDEVAKLANGLKQLGVKKGDRVCIYMPMILQASYAMLACARIGAIHSVVFGGFSPEALKDRILDSECKIVITADEGMRGGKTTALKASVDQAIATCDCVDNVIVVRNTEGKVAWNDRDVWYHDLVENMSNECPCEPFDAETPLFILYTSGSTGKPKGVLHTTGGYLLYVAMTHKYVFDYQEGDVYWCTADVGWVTGHSYIVYGPLANGATTLMFEGVPTYPDAARFWQVIDKHQVNAFYTAPTAIRALMGAGDEFVDKSNRSSLRILGSVGEPINPEAWEWYYHKIGKGQCPIVDTWWQTETGGQMITPFPYATALKPGSASKPFFGIEPQVVNEQGEVLEGEAEGILVIAKSWPGQMRTLYNNHERFMEAYFSTFPGKYFSGDGVKRDADGYYWITGRVDDVLNISGHRLGTAEIESALVLHKGVAEAAVVGYPHEIKGQGIYAYVSLMNGIKPTDALKAELVMLVRSEIGAIATVDKIQFAPRLPKTRSGKIMRRILRKIAENDYDNLGDISTLSEPEVVESLIKNKVEDTSRNPSAI
ncbi:acetyl-CoA synthetase [Bathymodiolus thermophilus thioautotrophic gill symbiont]|uniref:Acetyl-coenzyme A synthetase n=1 Tax=Bathymodiolus thermophilus thioautotrophic gill symbiont TaxID=2360 RepID=A0A3G3IMQ9_9GAMM|nr:acetate--CoA ligase [Bathymodiolus thermophilus thioautotrophic gill symbiont]AYQ57113.1 acetyl-CoA synthetase [Bathymodiolus thermophilus thioautotrophic gill symbiont]CAB5499941.1 Acetyl-CoA synthetase (EC [Bathymodiolus thermophilus thioautotrophic gill symbiont]